MCEHKTTTQWVNNQVWCNDCREEISGELERPALIRVIEEEVKSGYRCTKCEEYLGEDEEKMCSECVGCEKCGGELGTRLIGDEGYDFCKDCNFITH